MQPFQQHPHAFGGVFISDGHDLGVLLPRDHLTVDRGLGFPRWRTAKAQAEDHHQHHKSGHAEAGPEHPLHRLTALVLSPVNQLSVGETPPCPWAIGFHLPLLRRNLTLRPKLELNLPDRRSADGLAAADLVNARLLPSRGDGDNTGNFFRLPVAGLPERSCYRLLHSALPRRFFHRH